MMFHFENRKMQIMAGYDASSSCKEDYWFTIVSLTSIWKLQRPLAASSSSLFRLRSCWSFSQFWFSSSSLLTISSLLGWSESINSLAWAFTVSTETNNYTYDECGQTHNHYTLSMLCCKPDRNYGWEYKDKNSFLRNDGREMGKSEPRLRKRNNEIPN